MGAYKCQRFISWDVSSVFCYWNAEITASLKGSPVEEEKGICQEKGSHTDELPHISGDFLTAPLQSLHFISDY